MQKCEGMAVFPRRGPTGSAALNIDEQGLDKTDRLLLTSWRCSRRIVGVETLAAATAEKWAR